MPLYRITAPNGLTYQIEGPPGASDADVADAVMAQHPEAGQAPKQSTIGSELVRGGKQVLSSARTGIGSIFDPVGAAKAGVARSEDIGKEAGEGVSLEAVKKAYRDKGLLSAAGETVSQIPRALAGQGANLASMYAGAKAGSTAGAAFGVPGRAIGAALGTGAVLLPQFAGSNVERQAEEQMDAGKNVDINRTKAYSAALGQAALEGAGTAFTLGKRVIGGVLGLTENAALKTAAAQAELVKAAERSLAASAGRGVVRGAAEMPVEVAQQILERYQAGLELTSPEAYKEYGESAYQAMLIGGPLGGAAGTMERGQARGQLDQQRRAEEAARPRAPREPEQAPEEVVPGAKLPETARVGTQGTLFTPKEMGKRVAEEKEEPAPAKPAAVQQGEQLGLGLDFQREYTDLYKERDRLREGPQTPEVKARIAELSGQLASYDEADIGQRQAEKLIKEEKRTKEAEQKAADEAAAQRFPGLAGPTTAAITQADIDAIGLPLKTSKQWIQDNVLGKTVEEIKALVQREPNLLSGKGARAEVLKALVAPQPTAFTEKKDEPTITKTDKPQGELDLGGGESGVGVSGKPTGTDVVQPGTRVPTTTGTPTTPDGLGLAPAGQPVGTGTTPQGTQPPAITTPVERTANVVFEEIRALTAEQQALLTKAGRIPAVKSPARKKWDSLSVQIDQKKAEWADLDKAERLAKGTNAPTTTPPATGAPATTPTTAGPKKTTGRTTKTTTPKTPQAPAPTVATETVDEEAARKAEAEEFKRRLDDLERKQKEDKTKAAAPAPTPAPKTEKPEPKELPEKLREPVGTTEFGAKEGEEEVLRGPQGMLFPMSKREELEYAKKKEKLKDIDDLFDESEIEELPPAGQKKLDFGVGNEIKTVKDAEAAGRANAQSVFAERANYDTWDAAVDSYRINLKDTLKDDGVTSQTLITAALNSFEAEVKKQHALLPKAKQFYDRVVIEPTWSKNYGTAYSPVVYEDDEFALVRELNVYNQPRYFAINQKGKQATTAITADGQPNWLNQKQIDRLRDAALALGTKELELARNNLDGPFTTGKNVVVSDDVDSAIRGYTENLLNSLGLGDLRIFIHGKPDKADTSYIDKYKLFGHFAHLADPPKESWNGSATTAGTDGKTHAIYLNPRLSETHTIEVLAHEIGHIVQQQLYDNASTAEQKAITDEYLAWRKKAKLATTRDLMYMLRNRNDAENNVRNAELNRDADSPASQSLKEFDQYWISFSEWFADNVSRWATTNDKPLSIADKFFSKVAQKLRDLVSFVSGRKFPPAKSVADFLNKAGPANFTPVLNVSLQPEAQQIKKQFSVSFGAEQLIDSLGPLNRDDRSKYRKLVDGVQANPDIGYVTKFRTQVTDIAATIEKRLGIKFDGAVRNSLGELNPMGLYRQAQDYTKMLLEYFQTGTLYKDPVTGLWKSGIGEGVRPPAEVYALIDKYAAKNGYSRERATQIASRVLEGVRLNEMRRSNKQDGTTFLIHLKDNEIDLLVREFNADPDLKEMSKLMDEARVEMVNNMVKVGRLSAEEGKLWREVVGYVPFDRETIDAVAANFNKAKKISGKGLAQLGKLPELVGSLNRPVGNVFDNYLNTLGWMVGQTLKSDATLLTLRSLEDVGHAKFLGRTNQGQQNVVGAYVNGEMMYWSVPSKYDVMAFKDLNPPKAGWLRALGAFSNILRKAVTALPPFALKQVTDDVQRAILTSGVRNPGALIWMSLTNFPKLALAELRGIQHPMVKDFGRLGLTGEYDFEAGKPATSLLKDLGFKKRGRFETLIHRLDGITRASDLAVRKAIYDQTINETKDELLAQTRAREFINFRRRGASDFVGAMVTTIPFFNAYIQGMDVLYRAASGIDSSSSVDRAQARQLFWSRAAIVTTLSLMYALGKDDDDEDYNNMDLRTRDNNWILGNGYKIGVPGELGAIFKVIPERVVEYMKRQGTPEEQTAFDAMRTTLSYMFEQYLGRAMPVPQAIKPVMEAWANKSFLTGKDLEGYHHRAMDPSMRMTEQTSELAKAISKFSRDEIGVEVSPIMIDNTLRGYLGSTAAMFTMVTDSLLNPTRLDRPLHKYALLSNYLYDPVGTRRMTEFYEEREKVGKANTTLNELMKTDLDRAEKYVAEHEDELELEGLVNSTLEQLERTRAYRKYLNSPEGAADMSKEDREAELKEIKQAELEYVQWVREAKTELRKVQR